MKAKELMIGDWVRNALLNEVFKMNTTSMRNMCWDEDNGTARYTIEPIPLTEEILKANGFTANEHWYYKRVRENGVFDVCVSFDYKEIEITKVCGAGTDDVQVDYGLSIDICRGEIFVHKFQQILRIYDLYELADNFKVNE